MTTANTRPRILVAEDDPSIRRLLTMVLGLDFQVFEAEDGQEAMDAVTGGMQVDAFVLDVMMPRKDGFALAEELRASTAHAATPIIMLTALAGPEHRERARRIGVDAFMNKPFEPDMLIATLEMHVGVSAAA